jgi:hypothetical protein
VPVTPDDLVAYIAAVTAHSGYTKRFRADLRVPGLRIPITVVPALWTEAVDVGRQVLWLHTFGERHHDAVAGRPKGYRALAKPITGMPSREARDISYHPPSQTLHIGTGSICPVTPEVWDCDVGGMRVIRHWLNYRTAEHHGRSSELDRIGLQRWTVALTDELLALISVLTGCVALWSQQNDLLHRICQHQTVSASELRDNEILPPPHASTIPPPTSPKGPNIQTRLDDGA